MVLALAAMAPGASAQNIAVGRLFVCDVVQRQQLRTDGTLGPTDFTEVPEVVRAYSRFTFDEARGTLRWRSSEQSLQFEILQGPDEANSLEAVRVLVLSGYAQVTIETLRIQTWREGWPFVNDSDGRFYAGTCRLG